MNRSKCTYFITIALFFAFASIACEGPTGSDGPQGPQGQEGAEGPQGPQGEPGTANVIYSEWMDFDWNLSDETTSKQMYIEETRVVEEDFIANGTLLAYFKLVTPDGLAIVPLPFTQGTDRLKFVIGDLPSEGIEGIVIQLEATDGTSPVQSDWTDYQLRYVMIPGGVPAKMSKDFLKDYNAVKEYYGIAN